MSGPALSIVIPTLNAAESLPATLAALAAGPAGEGVHELLVAEVLVADGGSRDATVALAREAGCRVLAAPRGRGAQLAAGGAAAAGDWLLFLHADTRLADDWGPAVAAFIADPANRARAGYFRLSFASVAPAARRVERLAAWRARRLGLPFGDQGLLLHRDFYRMLGGFRPLPLMEDVDLVRRIGRRRLCALPAVALTSPARYERDGWLCRPLRNLGLQALYFAGVPPRWLARLYR